MHAPSKRGNRDFISQECSEHSEKATLVLTVCFSKDKRIILEWDSESRRTQPESVWSIIYDGRSHSIGVV